MHGWQTVLMAGTVALTLGCKSFPSTQYSVATSLLKGTPPQVRERLLTQIPIGTAQINAERHVKSLGLELTPQFELGSESYDSIHCRHTERNGLLGEVTWLIQIDCRDGVVADIICEQLESKSW